MRIPVRLLAMKLLAGALLAAALQFQLWAETERFVPLGLGQMWFELHPSSFTATQAAVEQHVWPALWDPVMVTMLRWEAWAVLGAPALVLLAVPFRREPRQPLLGRIFKLLQFSRGWW
jgi:hypothetical protein